MTDMEASLYLALVTHTDPMDQIKAILNSPEMVYIQSRLRLLSGWADPEDAMKALLEKKMPKHIAEWVMSHG